MFQEVEPEQHSDNGGGDEEADAHAALNFYFAALDALPFPEDEPAPHRA